jgi:hypothetical protein
MNCDDIMKPKIRITFLLFGALATACSASAQPFSIDWHTIDGGGGTSTGALYSVTGTIGQPDAGKMSGTNYSIDGGFWGIIAVVQTPGAPLLSIQPTNSGVILSWPAPSTGFVLQENSAPVATNWMDVTNDVNIAGSQKQVLVSPAIGSKFYRLKK